MILLQAKDIAKQFAGQSLYEHVSFNIQTQDRIALVGRNGAGKSTLLKQIIGQEPISHGEITTAKGLKIGYLEQHVAVDSPLTVWQEMLTVFKDKLKLRDQAHEAANKVALLSEDPNSRDYQAALEAYDQINQQVNDENVYAIESDIRTVLHGFRFFEKDYDQAVSSLSGGQKTRLAMAKLLLTDYDLLILDEPTNHLDMDTLNWLEGFLAGYHGALLIVSHDRYFLNKVANQVIELRHGQAHLYKGNYDFYLQEKALRMAQEIKAYEKQQAEIDKLEDFIQKNISRASTTKRAQSRRKQLEKMDRIDKPLADQNSPRMSFSAKRSSGDRVIEAQDLAIGYSREAPALASHINFDLRRQEALAIVGPNGIGKTTLLKTLIKQIPALQGTIEFGSKIDLGYYDQNVNHLDPNLTVLETLWQAHDTTDEWIVRSILGSFLFSGETVEKKVSLLSGGEKARLSLALLATDHDNTLLLDEPTNHLDIDSKEVLEDALIQYDGTLVFVSHDRYFINRIATQILEIQADGANLYLGDYDYYVRKKQEFEAIQDLKDQATASSKNASASQPGPSRRQRSYQEDKLLKKQARQLGQAVDQALALVEDLDQAIEKIHLQMVEANENNDQDQLLSLTQDLESTEIKQEAAMEDWETASLDLEAFLEDYPEFDQA